MVFKHPSELIRFRNNDEGLVMSRQSFLKVIDTVQSISAFPDEIIDMDRIDIEDDGKSVVMTNANARFFGLTVHSEILRCELIADCSIYLNAKLIWQRAAQEIETLEVLTVVLSIAMEPGERSLEIARIIRENDQVEIDRQFVSEKSSSCLSHPNGRNIAERIFQLTAAQLPAVALMINGCDEPWRRILFSIQSTASLLRLPLLDRAIQAALKSEPAYQPSSVLRALEQNLPGLMPETFSVHLRPTGVVRLDLARLIDVGQPMRSNEGYRWAVTGLAEPDEWIVAQVNNLGKGVKARCKFTSALEPSFSWLEEAKPTIIARGSGEELGEILIHQLSSQEPIVQCAVYRPHRDARVMHSDSTSVAIGDVVQC